MRNKTTTTADALRALSSLLCVGSFALSRRDRALAAACAGASLALAAVDLLLRLEGHDGDADDAPRRPPRPRARARSSDYESDAGSVATARDEAPAPSPPKQHVTELLVHNVSHTDLVVSFGGPDDGFDDLDDDAALFARPKFSHFAAVSAELLDAARRSAVVARCRSRRRDDTCAKYPVVPSLGGPGPRGEDRMPCGLALRGAAPWSAARVRNELKTRFFKTTTLRDHADANANPDPAPVAPRRVYFPLLAVLLRAWLASTDDGEASKDRVVLLVSGAGTPRDANRDARDNSTEHVAELMELFLARACEVGALPFAVTVVRLHSEANVFRYDENISFVRHELEPAVVALRQTVVGAEPGDDWADRFRVAISFADGAPARVSTIHKSLRLYRPTCMYVWQLKTFWEQRVLSEDDVEVLPFEAAETVPATPTAEATGDVRVLVAEVRRLRAAWDAAIADPAGHDMRAFWHRKSRKVVLAVLLVRKGDGEAPKVYHGTNMEVSMPTGSLCAERNVIGTALADDLSLKRSHLQLIAVLGLNLPPPESASASEPSWLTPPPSPSAQASSANSPGAGWAERRPRSGSDPSLSPASFARAVAAAAAGERMRDPPRRSPSHDAQASPPPSSADRSCPPSPSGRRQMVRAYPKMRHSSKKRVTPASTTRVVVSDTKDMNPLKPCGACAEWLRKITEVNPNFKVVTFTDAHCHGVYVEPVAGSG